MTRPVADTNIVCAVPAYPIADQRPRRPARQERQQQLHRDVRHRRRGKSAMRMQQQPREQRPRLPVLGDVEFVVQTARQGMRGPAAELARAILASGNRLRR